MSEPQGNLGNHTDIRRGNWVDTLLPGALRPFARLARWDRPIGFELLLYPCWWAIALAAAPGELPDFGIAALFLAGAILMRGAGCTWNDILDRDIDAHVERTAVRPLPAGDISLAGAFAFLALQIVIALAILISLPKTAIWVGLAVAPIVIVYPLAKRFVSWPQIVLGLCFNWGVFLGWAAVRDGLDWPLFLLYFAGIAWTICYDTIYAHQDQEGDTLLGLGSTALVFGKSSHVWLLAFAGAMAALAAAYGLLDGRGWAWFAGILGGCGYLLWRIIRLDPYDKPGCLAAFKANRWVGLALVAGAMAERWLA